MRTLVASARSAGGLAVASGRWLADATVDLAERLPPRDLLTLRNQHAGLSGADLGDRLIRNASRASAAVGAMAGALMTVEELAPPVWAVIPLEIVAETAIVVAIELKLVAELHAAAGIRLPEDQSRRIIAVGRAWSDRRGIHPSDLLTGAAAADIVGREARVHLAVALRRRLLRRTGRSMASLLPAMAGAAAGAVVNSRATRTVGQRVWDDLWNRRV
jgi:hypothetical protein